MKKIIALFGSLLILGSTKSKAQKPQQPVKKETTKPASGTTPKADAMDTYLKTDGASSAGRGTNAASLKGANPASLKGANPTLKPWQSVPKRQAAPSRTVSPANVIVKVPR